MGTYDDIAKYVEGHHRFVPKSCWIAHVKELNDLPVRRAWNRSGRGRQVPCPPEKWVAIEQAFRHFGLI